MADPQSIVESLNPDLINQVMQQYIADRANIAASPADSPAEQSEKDRKLAWHDHWIAKLGFAAGAAAVATGVTLVVQGAGDQVQALSNCASIPSPWDS